MAIISNGLMKKETSLRGFRLHLCPGLHAAAKIAVFPLYLPLAFPCQRNLSISSRKSRRSSLNKSYVI